MIKEGSLVKVVGKRNYDFMDTVLGEVFMVDEISVNKKGETYAELIASDELIERDSYLKYKGVIGFLLSELELVEEEIEFVRTVPLQTIFEAMSEIAKQQ